MPIFKGISKYEWVKTHFSFIYKPSVLEYWAGNLQMEELKTE